MKKTELVNCKDAQYDIYIGRPSKWGNPFTDKISRFETESVNDREEAIRKYEEWIRYGDGKHLLNDLHELEGKTLGCWCKPKKCHGDILLKLLHENYISELFE